MGLYFFGRSQTRNRGLGVTKEKGQGSKTSTLVISILKMSFQDL